MFGMLAFSNTPSKLGFGQVDPSTITLFHDVLFVDNAKFDAETMGPATVDPHIKYTPVNHFDLKNWISVKEGDKRKTSVWSIKRRCIGWSVGKLRLAVTLFGTVHVQQNSIAIQRSFQTLAIYSFFTSNLLESLQLPVISIRLALSSNFKVAFGPKGMFDTILVIFKDPVTNIRKF